LKMRMPMATRSKTRARLRVALKQVTKPHLKAKTVSRLKVKQGVVHQVMS